MNEMGWSLIIYIINNSIIQINIKQHQKEIKSNINIDHEWTRTIAPSGTSLAGTRINHSTT